MISPHKIGDALMRVKKIADQRGAAIVKSSEISRVDREMLTQSQWLLEIIRGWYVLSRPDIAPGDSAAWHANFWDFLRIYLHDRFGNNYCLSAEASLELHIGATLIPAQVIVIAKEGGGIQSLPFNTSLLIYSDPRNLPEIKQTINGLQVMPLPFALCKISPTYYRKFSENVEIALRSVRAPTHLTQAIMEGEFRSAAERIIGAYQFFGMEEEAQKIKNDLAGVGMQISVRNPFSQDTPHLLTRQFRSPYAARIELMWHKYRQAIIDIFPKEIGLPDDPKKYLAQVNALYVYDAYNSLSID